MTYDYDVADPVVVGATKAFAKEFGRYVHLDNDAVAVLQKLHRRYKLGLTSNFGILGCGRELGKIRPSRVFRSRETHKSSLECQTRLDHQESS